MILGMKALHVTNTMILHLQSGLYISVVVFSYTLILSKLGSSSCIAVITFNL